MAYNAAGKWEYENANVAPRVANIVSSDNPLIKAARSQGLAASNRRGLLNSSIAIGASEAEAYKVATPIAMQEAAQIQQSNMGEQDRVTQLERLTADAGFTASRQSQDIAAQMDRLRAQAGFQTAQIAQQGEISTAAQLRDNVANMERLRESGAQQSGLQASGNAAEMARLREAAVQNREAATQQFGFQTALNTQGAAAEMTRLQAQLAGADTQQRREIDAQMARLRESGAIDERRILLQANIESALQASGAQQQRALAQVQGEIQSVLNSQTNDQQLQRMGAEFAQQTSSQVREQQFAMERLAATGNQEVQRLVLSNQAETERLAMSISQNDRQAIAASTINIFQAEAQMRAALLSNPQMPAAERAAYEQAISTMGAPARAFVNQLYGGPASPALPTPAGLNAGGALVPASPVMIAPPDRVATAARSGLNAGSAVPLAMSFGSGVFGDMVSRAVPPALQQARQARFVSNEQLQ